MAEIVTLTVNPAIDQSVEVDDVAPNRKLRTRALQRDPGGGGSNVARTICTLGGDALALWTCGGHTGALYADLLQRECIDHRLIAIEGMTREHLIVHEKSTGDVYRFGEEGPLINDEEAQAILSAVYDLNPAPRYLVLSGSLPPGLPDDFYAQITSGMSAETRVIVDAVPSALAPALPRGVYLSKPNVRELGEMLGEEIEGRAEIVEASRRLIAETGTSIIVTSIAAGGAVVVGEGLEEQIAAPTVRVKSKVGAGDSMVGGMVLGLQRGMSLREAVRFGVATGSAAVMSARTGLEKREDAERLYERMREQQGQ